VRMANLAQIVNVIAPILTRPDGLVLQTIFYPFELYSRVCGDESLDVTWEGDTFSGGNQVGVRLLDVVATISNQKKKLSLFVVNRALDQTIETQIALTDSSFTGIGKAWIVNGKDIKVTNTFDGPEGVTTRSYDLEPHGSSWVYAFEPHSVTCLELDIA